MKKNTILILLVAFFMSCEKKHSKLVIINNTIKPVYHYEVFDTVFTLTENNFYNYPNYLINPNDTAKPTLFGGTQIRNKDYNLWEERIKQSPSKHLSIFILNKDTLNKYPKDIIWKYNKYQSKHTFTIDSLKKCNWTLTLN